MKRSLANSTAALAVLASEKAFELGAEVGMGLAVALEEVPMAESTSELIAKLALVLAVRREQAKRRRGMGTAQYRDNTKRAKAAHALGVGQPGHCIHTGCNWNSRYLSL